MKNKIVLIFLGCSLMTACSKREANVQQKPKTKYYRIKQVDADGKVTYSKVIKVVQ